MKRILILTLFMLMLVACATAGTKFDFSQARQLKIGMDEQQVTQIMGAPNSVVSRSTGQVWIWSYANANGFSVKSRSVSVVMRDGKVVEVPNIPQSF